MTMLLTLGFFVALAIAQIVLMVVTPSGSVMRKVYSFVFAGCAVAFMLIHLGVVAIPLFIIVAISFVMIQVNRFKTKRTNKKEKKQEIKARQEAVVSDVVEQILNELKEGGN